MVGGHPVNVWNVGLFIIWGGSEMLKRLYRIGNTVCLIRDVVDYGSAKVFRKGLECVITDIYNWYTYKAETIEEDYQLRSVFTVSRFDIELIESIPELDPSAITLIGGDETVSNKGEYHCNHAVGLTADTWDGSFVIRKSGVQSIGMMRGGDTLRFFNYCPICGIELKNILEGVCNEQRENFT